MTKTPKKTGQPTGKPVAKKTVANRQTVVATKEKKAAPVQTLKIVKADQKYEGARASWFAALLAYDGQTTDTFVDACTKSPPTLPKNGKPEDPRGWIRFFVRSGVATLS